MYWISFIILLLWGSSAFGDFPSLPGEDPWARRPNDPEYDSQWHLFSHLPHGHRNPNVTSFDKMHGSGMGVDRAWQLHLGSVKTRIAILDSGIDWNEPDLRTRIFLNQLELPYPEGFNKHDINNDGRVNVLDYTQDSRVRDHNKNGSIDVEDIIISFSNGIDEDDNGFVDDISGWDFIEDDNNPHDRIRYRHGTNQGLSAGAEVNNGIGGAGTCPECVLMFVRVSDTFIVDSNAFAASVLYATDMGVSLIQNALGGLNNNSYVRYAVNYAYDRDVVVVGTAADESSHHNNQPSVLDPIIYPNAIRYNHYDPMDASTFVNFNNCSNYGPRLDIAVSALKCSSEATANLSGMIGLVRSFSNILNKPLTAGEVVSLVKSTATDINFGSNHREPSRYSTYEGWDSMTGYGRADAWKMMLQTRNGKIPPEVRILSPEWFDIYRDRYTAEIPVRVKIGLPRSGEFSAQLSLAHGIDTAQSEFVEIASLKNQQRSFQGMMGKINKDVFAQLKRNKIDHPRYINSYTLRLTVEGRDGLKTEARRSFHFFEDELLHDNFPFRMSGSGESTGVFVDLFNTGKDVYVTGDGSGAIYAISSDQGLLDGFPYQLPRSRFALKNFAASPSITAPIAAGDVDGDGYPEIVAVSFEGDLTVINRYGQPLLGFPVRIEPINLQEAHSRQRLLPGVLAAPTLVDLDRDGFMEIVVMTLDGHVYVFDHRGSILPGLPFRVSVDGLRSQIVSSPAVADINGDGCLDIVFGSNHVKNQGGTIFSLDGCSLMRGKVEYTQNFPARIPLVRDDVLPTIGTGIPMSPAIADLDGDGHLEILVHGALGKLYALDKNGKISRVYSARVNEKSSTNDTYMIAGFGSPAIGHLKRQSSSLNPVAVGVGKKMLASWILGGVRYPYQYMLTAWNDQSREMLEGYPIDTDDMMISASPTLVDLDDDGLDEILYASGGLFMRALSSGGGEYPGFPHFTGGWSTSSSNVGDFDGDGFLDVAITTREGFLFIWKTSAKAKPRPSYSWPTFQGNNQRTGFYNVR